MDVELTAWVQQTTGALDVQRGDRIQSLWSGYGELTRLHLTHPPAAPGPSTAILKWVRPPSAAGAGGGHDAISHARKCHSYDVETAFYRDVARRCDDSPGRGPPGASCRVPRMLGARKGEGEWVLLLEDLDAAGFPSRDRDPRGHALNACLDWLAAFHARFLDEAPHGLWTVGTYWHLDTRRHELANIRDAKLRDAAPDLDRRLRAARFRTLVHGDAKPANFCFSADGARVAAVDFQYVGGGVGVSDVAYLIHGAQDEQRALDHYFAQLRRDLPEPCNANALEAEWRSLYAVAAQDFERFLAGWRR